MPYGNNRGYSGNRSGGGARRSGGATAARLTGLFKTKRQGLWVGSIKDEQLDTLIEKIKAAKKAGKGITCFLWKNDEGAAAYSLSADIERDAPAPRQAIEDDDAGGDDLFKD